MGDYGFRRTLLDLLNPWQSETFSAHQYIDVRSDEGRKWRIQTRLTAGNTWYRDEDYPRACDYRWKGICTDLRFSYPEASVWWITQFLMLKANEAKFMHVGCPNGAVYDINIEEYARQGSTNWYTKTCWTNKWDDGES